MTVAPARLPKALHVARLAASTSRRPCCSRRATAPRSTPAPRCSTPRCRTSATSSPTSRGVDPDEFADQLYTYHDDAAVAHLFAVAAGLDSMIIGEGEILGQVREAWRAAERGGDQPGRCSRARSATRSRSASGPAPRPASAGTRRRCRRPRWRSPTSRLGSLDGRRVLVLGAGEMGEGMALALARRRRARDRGRQPHVAHGARRSPRASAVGPSARRRPRRARRRATCCSLHRRHDVLVERGRHRAGDEPRDGRALLIVDIAVPRDVDPGVGRGVRRDPARHRRPARVRRAVARAARAEIGHVREIIADELERYRLERSAREVAPLVAALRDRAEELRDRRARAPRAAKLDALDPAREARRGAHPGHRQQAAARAHRPREGRGRARRAASSTPTPRRPVRPRTPSPSPTTDAAPAAHGDARQRARPLAGATGRGALGDRRRAGRGRHDHR